MKRSRSKIRPTIKLDLSQGQLPENHPFIRPKGFDPLASSWALKNESVSEAYSAHLFQRIPAHRRETFMEELWRVLVPAGTAVIIVPYYTSMRAIQDPTAQWPPLCEVSFMYFNKQFRANNSLSPIRCDFDFVYGYDLDMETRGKSDDVQPFWIKHYTNAVSDLHITLTKRR